MAVAIEGLPLQGNTLCLKPILPKRHILFPQSLVTPTQSYKHSLSLWKSQPWLGFVGTFLRRLPLKQSTPFPETQAGAWRNTDLCGQVENWIWPLHFTLHKHSSHSTVPFRSEYKENMSFIHKFCTNNFPEACFALGTTQYIFSCKEADVSWIIGEIFWIACFKSTFFNTVICF